MNRFIALLSVVIMMMGCAQDRAYPVKTTYDSKDKAVSQITYLTEEQYVDMQIAKSKVECQKAYYKQTEGLTEAKDIMLANAFQALNQNDPCPTITTNNDVRVVQTKERHQTVRKAIGLTVPVVGIIKGAEVAETAVENRDPVIVNQPEPIIVEPTIVEVPASP